MLFYVNIVFLLHPQLLLITSQNFVSILNSDFF